ncbi:MAG: hypothetical protein GYA14_08570 [Ignavibacteria bacterium]|jgi:hypothetical protein|nr:hypothetical protein [Ignavibacteria bacterium]
MNAEKLYKISSELKDEFDKINVVNVLTQLKRHLQNMVNQPQQLAHQQNLTKSKKQLFDYLETAPSNDFSPIWRQIIEEIGGINLVGKNLKQRIENAFNSNQITPSSALEEINTILTETQSFYNGLNQINAGFASLNIGMEELEPGHCELSYLIPRKFTEENLSSLKKEIAELNFILNNISEVATGEKQEFKVNTLSSSDYTLYIELTLLIGNILIIATEKILNTYKTILEIKNLRNQLKEKGVPEKETKGIEQYANSTMETEIVKLAKEMVTQHYKGKDSARKNELINGLTISFNKIANRIDNGFNLDIRVETLPEAGKEEEKSAEQKQQEQFIKNIQKSSKSLEFINTSGDSILSLEEGKEDVNGTEENKK